MKLNYLTVIFALFLLSSCETTPDKITDPNDYNAYLASAENQAKISAKNDRDFWKQKIEKTPNQFPYLGKLATTNSTLFQITGEISYLIQAEKELNKAIALTHAKSPSYLKSLAANYISQHRFIEALELLTKAEQIGDQLDGTQKMLFDVHLELGNYDLAEAYLTKFRNVNDFDYLIRVSKWNDHKGDLDTAIRNMEKAMAIAESSNVNGLKQWSYTNLADFYGHAGRIQESYTYFLKALELNPNDAYSKKGIAWIVYSHEKNPEEALRILNAVTTDYVAPDYNLLKAEIAEFIGDTELQTTELETYQLAMRNSSYGDMYNKYNVLLQADEPNLIYDAIHIAKKEVNNRPTPQSYDLLAWTYFKNGELDLALEIVENNVVNKTFEPESLYHVAEIYKAAGKTELVKPIKKELIGSIYELGPTMKAKIERL